MRTLELLEAQQKICALHAQRLQMALDRLNPFLPFDTHNLNNLDPEHLGYLELLTNRFSKLQDAIGAKIFPLILEALEEQEDISKKTFIDILNRLEKLEILPSTDHWRDMRDIRNHITHEYPENPNLMVINLNKAISFIQDLLTYWSTLNIRIQKLVSSK
jgi:hypothetical protein